MGEYVKGFILGLATPFAFLFGAFAAVSDVKRYLKMKSM